MLLVRICNLQNIDIEPIEQGMKPEDLVSMKTTLQDTDKQKIRSAVELLAELPLKTDSHRRQIITEFVEKVTIGSNGEVFIKADLFGIKAEVRAGDSSPDYVRIQTDIGHQLSRIRTLFVYRGGFVIIISY